MSAEQPDIATLYPQLRTTLLAFLRRHTGDAQAAEDILHDVVLKALLAERLPGPVPRHLSAWLYAVARNAAIDFHRRKRPHDALPEDLADERGDAGSTMREALALCLRPMAERLPPLYRDTLLAAEFDGQPLRAVAQAQGLTLAAVKTRACRGRRLLQAQLVACCRVELAQGGQLLDYDQQAAERCAQASCGDCDPYQRPGLVCE